MVWLGAVHVAVFTPPQLYVLVMQGLTMYSGLGQEQMEPAALSSVPEPQRPVRHERPPQDHVPVALVRSAVAIAVTTEGSEHVTPVVSNVPEIVMDEQPVASSVDTQLVQAVHWVVAMTRVVNACE